MSTRVDTDFRYGMYLQVAAFVLSALVIISRRPDCVWNPQFYAEDGRVWFADAYMRGWLTVLLKPEGGYIVAIPRLAAALALLVPFHLAPLVMSAVGILFQALPASFLISERCRKLGSLRLRALLAIAYLVIPNSAEIHVTVTNVEWHASLLAFLIMVALPPRDAWSSAFDVVMLLLAGLTGPFAILLAPIAVLIWRRRRGYWEGARCWIVFATAFIQGLVLFTHINAARGGVLGVSLSRLFDLLGGHIYFGLLLGHNPIAVYGPHLATVLATILGSGLTAFLVIRARSFHLSLFVLFCGLVLVASLASPYIPGSPKWEMLKSVVNGRYWFYPMLAFVWSAIWCAEKFWHEQSPAKVLALTVLACSLFGFVRDYRLPPWPDTGFRSEATRFEAAPRGAGFRAALFPDLREMLIVKR